MDKEVYKKAVSIKDKLHNLEKMEKWLKEPQKNVCINTDACIPSLAISLNFEMRKVLLHEVLREKEILEKRFEEL